MTTPRLAAAIEAEEGRELAAYPDPRSPLAQACRTAGLAVTHYRALTNWKALSGAPWTIGVGQTGTGIGPDTVWTDSQATAALHASIQAAEAALDDKLPWWRSMCDARQDVLVQMVFQLGINGVLAFHRTLGAMHDHDYAGAAKGMLQSLWARQTPARADRLAKIMETGAYPQ